MIGRYINKPVCFIIRLMHLTLIFLVGSRTRTLKILSIFSIVYMYVINFAGIPPWLCYLRRFKSCVQLVKIIIAKIIAKSLSVTNNGKV